MVVDGLIGDTYAGDGYGADAIRELVMAGAPWHGLGMKASEGTYYPANRPTDREWFLDNWMRARVYAGVRYGKDWFRYAYHYYRVGEDGKEQAENFLNMVETAGGFGLGDMWPMIDVESAENPADASASQIEDEVGAFVETIHANSGRRVALYGNVYIWDRGITSHMGCDLLVVARYASDLPPATYQRIGWELKTTAAFGSVLGWQLEGDGEEYVPGYPKQLPIGKAGDYTAMIIGGGGQAALDWIAANINAAPAP